MGAGLAGDRGETRAQRGTEGLVGVALGVSLGPLFCLIHFSPLPLPTVMSGLTVNLVKGEGRQTPSASLTLPFRRRRVIRGLCFFTGFRTVFPRSTNSLSGTVGRGGLCFMRALARRGPPTSLSVSTADVLKRSSYAAVFPHVPRTVTRAHAPPAAHMSARAARLPQPTACRYCCSRARRFRLPRRWSPVLG